MENEKNRRLQKSRHSDTALTFNTFIDPSELPLVDCWENLDPGPHQTPRRASLLPSHPLSQATETMTHRQASLTFTADSSLSSGFASDLSSVAASSRFPSFSLASLESLEGTDLAWLSALDPNSSDFLKRNKNLESSTLQRKSRRCMDARQRSGSIAASTFSTGSIPDQQVQRNMSYSVPTLNAGSRQFNTKGNIFRQRRDFSVFQRLQAWKRNGYFIQLEDDSCTGNEDTRAFVLCQLTGHGAAEVQCLACARTLPVYDHFPLLDGALFLSPFCHRGGLQVSWNAPLPPPSTTSANASSGVPTTAPSAGQLMLNNLAPPPGCTGPRQQQQQNHHYNGQTGSQGRHRASSISHKRYLHAVCMACMRSIDSEIDGDGADPSVQEFPQIVCKFCHTVWSGSTLLIGGLYTYDLFACSPCCEGHLRCKSCGLQPLPPRQESEKDEKSVNYLRPLPYFSQYSQLVCCQHCRTVDYHFIKSFDEMYDVCMPS